MKAATIILALFFLATASAEAWTGRRAVLYAEAQVMLARNEPYRWGSADCSMQLWRLLNKVFPELRVNRWFRRTTADVMASWPWEAVMRLEDLIFGDIIFKGHPRLDHVMMVWDPADRIIHASRKRGFAEDTLWPYWGPQVSLIVRPPY